MYDNLCKIDGQVMFETCGMRFKFDENGIPHFVELCNNREHETMVLFTDILSGKITKLYFVRFTVRSDTLSLRHGKVVMGFRLRKNGFYTGHTYAKHRIVITSVPDDFTEGELDVHLVEVDDY